MKKHSSKKKALLIALAVIVVLILGAVGAVYGVTHGFYRSSNYTSDEDAMKDFTNVGEDTTAEDDVNPEDATGEVLSDEEQQELDAKLAEFADSEPVTNDGNVYNVLLVGVDRRDKSWAGNSDSMILMSLNYEKKQITLPTTEDRLEKERQKRLHAEEYRQKLLAVIPGMFRKWEPILGVQSAKVTIRPTRSQWGSCNTRNGNISISLWLGAYPEECIEYVVVHELTHLLERGHNARFYGLLDQHYPDWKTCRERLKQDP